MNKVIVTYYNKSEKEDVQEEFENVIGHQVAGSVVQIVLNDGTQRIINGFTFVDVEPDEEDKKRSLALAEKAYNEAKEEAVEDPADTSE